MKAMIFAAGLGTRLGSLTQKVPKALVLAGNKTLLEHTISKLKYFGFNDIIINVHHYAEQIIDFLNKNSNFNANISISNESDELLDTGGGLFKAQHFFNDNKPFLVHNVDILSDINLYKLYNFHIEKKGIATLAVKNRRTSRYFLFNEDLSLAGWQNVEKNELIYTESSKKNLISLAFSGIQIVNPSIFIESKKKGKFSLKDLYLEVGAKNKIYAYIHDDIRWMDLGKPENIIEAEKEFNL